MTRKPETIAFWRGRLPHWEVAGGRYFVTIHLAGAIPLEGEERIRELASAFERMTHVNPEKWLEQQRRIYSEMESWLDSAVHVAYLQQPTVAEMIVEAIAFRHERVWNVLEFVVMPNHLHLFFEVIDGSLKQSLAQFKRWTGHQAAKLLKLDGDRVWQDEWFDHWSRSDAEDDRISDYIRRNPEKAKLVSRYEDWAYGSWRPWKKAGR